MWIFILSVCWITEASNCNIGSLFAPNSFTILDFPPSSQNYIMPRVSGYFRDLVSVTSYKMNLYDQSGNLKSWKYQSGNVYPPGQLSIFGDYIQIENIPQSYTGEIVLYNGPNEVSCYSYSFRLISVS